VKTDLRTLAATIKARWICEQAHQQLKEELGLDHFEGRSWQGLHRHALMTMIAYAFLQYRRLKTARREKKNQRATARTDLSRHAPPCARPPSTPPLDHRRSDARAAKNGFAAKSSMNKSAKVALVHRRAHHLCDDGEHLVDEHVGGSRADIGRAQHRDTVLTGD